MAKKNKIPKTIAGVSLPKPLRRGLRDLAANQTGRDALIEALDAACAALAARQDGPSSGAAGKGRKADRRAAGVKALEEATRAFAETLRREPAKAAPTAAPSGPPPSAVTH